MPFKVRLKILLILAAIAIALFILSRIHGGLALLAIVFGLLYFEMIYPNLNFFGSAILSVKDQGPHAVAITFDDGPSDWTPKILDTLKQENIKATFFLLGQNVERFSEIAKRIETEGHAIGYHGYSHTKFHFRGSKFIRADLDRCVAAFQKAGLSPKSLVRFPHGFKNIFAVNEIRKRGWTLAGWGRGVWDSKRPGLKWIVDRSLEINAGDILLLHDGDGAKPDADRSQTAEAVLPIIQGLKAKGFSFVVLKS